MRGALQVHPCKLGRRIHAAHAPATSPLPTFDTLPAHPVDPRHAWMMVIPSDQGARR
ncbi:hypothetical protein BN1263200132 [Stenotrophomonas maltophilia]|nr:hypothetical protein BN1263200132 [Stenotrophomonas maltophilia]